MQLLVNKVFGLKHLNTEDGVLAELPALFSVHLPREKPIPAMKAKTRWEKFAEQKGIQKQKRGRMVYNEEVKDWVPRWGAGSTKKIEDKHNWCLPHREGMADDECPFQKRKDEKNLNMAKQKIREVRNKAEALGEKIPLANHVDPHRMSKRGKAGLNAAMKRAQTSSGSHGKFDAKAKNEKAGKGKGKKQFMQGNEKSANLKLMGRVLKGEHNLVNKTKAANTVIAKEQKERAEKKEEIGGAPRKIKTSRRRHAGKKTGVA